MGSIPGLGRFPGEGNGNLLQYSCLENPRDRGPWWYSPWGRKTVRHDLDVTKQQITIGTDVLKLLHINMLLIFIILF